MPALFMDRLTESFAVSNKHAGPGDACMGLAAKQVR